MLRDKPSHNERDLKVNVYVSGVCVCVCVRIVVECWMGKEKKKNEKWKRTFDFSWLSMVWSFVLLCFFFTLLYFCRFVFFCDYKNWRWRRRPTNNTTTTITKIECFFLHAKISFILPEFFFSFYFLYLVFFVVVVVPPYQQWQQQQQ